MKSKFILVATAAILTFGGTVFSDANATEIIDFEDTYTDYYSTIPSGYHGFNWGGPAGQGWVITKTAQPGSGYEVGTTGRNSLFTQAYGTFILSRSAGHYLSWEA